MLKIVFLYLYLLQYILFIYYIYLLYIAIIFLYLYTYIYVCVCVCVCVILKYNALHISLSVTYNVPNMILFWSIVCLRLRFTKCRVIFS